jgi:hypothetical protein
MSRKTTGADLVLEPREAMRRLRRFEASTRYLAAAFPMLRRKHANEWVAILDGELRATANTLDEINERIRILALPRPETLVHYVDDGHRILVV